MQLPVQRPRIFSARASGAGGNWQCRYGFPLSVWYADPSAFCRGVTTAPRASIRRVITARANSSTSKNTGNFAPELRHQLFFPHDDHKPFRDRRHHLFPRQIPPAALDQIELRIHFVGPVHGQVQCVYVIERGQWNPLLRATCWV